MSRALVVHSFAIAALASCATVSGLADKEAVDCPGGCVEAGVTSDAPSNDSGPPPPDAAASFTKPEGWKLVAVASVADSEGPPGCPAGFDDASDVGTNPSAPSNTCECTCNVGQQAACTGAPTILIGAGNVCDFGAGDASYTNNPAGGCNTDFATALDRTGFHAKVKLAAASGGTCTTAATPHPERVQLSAKRRVCDETARCNGNACDATVPTPFEACVASPKGSGDQACPAGFPDKLVAGRADVTCNAKACTCTVTRTPCTGTFTYYKDTSCTTGPAGVIADDTCRNLGSTGMYSAYKIVATTTTGCTAAGSSAASVAPADVRTICCR
jgi:hypothetical protein